MENLQERVNDMLVQLQDELKEDFNNEIVSVDRITRFLISRKLNPEDAKKAIKEHLRWREENNINEIRRAVKEKPFLIKSFPHYEELHEKGLGMVQCVVHAGESRKGDLVSLEVLGGPRHNITLSEKDIQGVMNLLNRYYFTFFEKRSMKFEELGNRYGRIVAGLQVRDVSQLSFLPHSGIFSVIKTILSIGVNQYPESTSVAFFINTPSIFTAVFSMIKLWLPEETVKKISVLSGEAVHFELMKHVYPKTLEAFQGLTQGQDGDELSIELCGKVPTKLFAIEIEKTVSARDVGFLYFVLNRDRRTICWERLNEEESPKSFVAAKILYTSSTTNSDEQVNVNVMDMPPGTLRVSFPTIENVDEALLVLYLNNYASWFMSHSFKLKVIASEQ